MPPRRRVVRNPAASAAREGGGEHVPPPLVIPPPVIPPPPPPAFPLIDQAAIMQMVQQAAQGVVQQAAQEAARIAAQEVARQLAAAQQGQAHRVPHGPQIQVQQRPQIHVQQGAPVQVQGNPQVPPPQGEQHGVDEDLMRVMRRMKHVDLEKFRGTVNATEAYQWKYRLTKCLRTIKCPLHICLNITELYLRGDAAVWWEGVCSMREEEDYPTYAEFLVAFDKKYFPKEALHQKRNEFQHLIQGGKTVRQYEHEFRELRMFAGTHFDDEDLMRMFLNGMRVDLRGRCSMANYTSLEDMVEKAVVQETCLVEEQKQSKAAQSKFEKTSESQKRTWDHTGAPNCGRCRRPHFGECFHCYSCGQYGHVQRNCRNRPLGAQDAAPAAAVVAPGACYTCGQLGHISRSCPTKGPAAKRQAIAPRVYALGEADGAERIGGTYLYHTRLI
ncbi:uncharacterized protein LOC108819859 [Raphanus sativus]|uniref:Uncharacterized protein LOC108819859 n=1 Tax=Raphanus sativus TaxID=3726 RepID=A0A6J0KLB0_RAPSA|nr:uncharacterized protein LOC108819859 [Raphanus sativus]